MTTTPKAETIADTATAGVRQLTEQFVAEAKKAAHLTLDTYETTFGTIADYTEKVGAASSIAAVSTLTAAQARAVRDLTGAYTSAARALLN